MMDTEQSLVYRRMVRLLTSSEYRIANVSFTGYAGPVIGSSSPHEHVLIAVRNNAMGHTIQITFDRLDIGIRGTFEFVCTDPLMTELIEGYIKSRLISRDSILFMMDSAQRIVKCDIVPRSGVYKWLGEGETPSELSDAINKPFGGKVGWQ